MLKVVSSISPRICLRCTEISISQYLVLLSIEAMLVYSVCNNEQVSGIVSIVERDTVIGRIISLMSLLLEHVL